MEKTNNWEKEHFHGNIPHLEVETFWTWLRLAIEDENAF